MILTMNGNGDIGCKIGSDKLEPEYLVMAIGELDIPVGSGNSPDTKDIHEMEPELILRFNNETSIDVMIDWFQHAKEIYQKDFSSK
jgi:hypothetical protein